MYVIHSINQRLYIFSKSYSDSNRLYILYCFMLLYTFHFIHITHNSNNVQIRNANNVLLSLNWMKISYQQHFINIRVAKIIQFSIFISKFIRWVIHNIMTDDIINNYIIINLVFTWSRLLRIMTLNSNIDIMSRYGFWA